jgi:hypothetical protein
MAVGVENVDKAMAPTRHVVMLCRILHCVRDKEIAVDVLDAEGREPSRNLRIRKGALDLNTAGLKPVDPLGANTSIVPARKFVAKRKIVEGNGRNRRLSPATITLPHNFTRTISEVLLFLVHKRIDQRLAESFLGIAF